MVVNASKIGVEILPTLWDLHWAYPTTPDSKYEMAPSMKMNEFLSNKYCICIFIRIIISISI